MNVNEAYGAFLRAKVVSAEASGFEVTDDELHPSDMPHQRDIVKWCARGGSRAVFATFGGMKTQIQLELARVTIDRVVGTSQTNRLATSGTLAPDRKALIVCPLGVKQEFKKDADRLGMRIRYCRTMAEVNEADTPYIITNYERVRDGDIDPNQFVFASLDEASCLRSVASKTYIEFLQKFKDVPYRHVFTATPSPNDYIELLNYAAFLGVMDVSQAKTRWFRRNSEKADKLTLHPHKEREFWFWVSSWAVIMKRFSDLGHSDEGFELPMLEIHYHRVTVPGRPLNVADDGQMKLHTGATDGLAGDMKEKKLSIPQRLGKVQEIMAAGKSDDHWLLWHHLEDERKAIEKSIPGVKAVYGKQPDEVKEELLCAFSAGDFPILATKPSIAGSGPNFQYHCHKAIFMGIDHKFNDFIQALHRILRFFQPEPIVEIHVIYTDGEDHVLRNLKNKWKQHEEEQEILSGILRQYGLNRIAADDLKRTIGVDRKVKQGNSYKVVLNDNVYELPRLSSDSIHLIHTSFPFSNQYEYTPSYNDFGHNDDDGAFFQQLDFVMPEAYRVLQPGRLAVIHVKDRVLFGNWTGLGFPTVSRFSDKVCDCFEKHGFAFMGRIVIVTDVVRENNQTYRLGWTEQCKDGSKMGAGMQEYLLIFRKPPSDRSNAYADVPVTKTKEEYTRGRWQIDADGFWRSSGNRLLAPEDFAGMDLKVAMKTLKEIGLSATYDYDNHVAVAEAMDEAGHLPPKFAAVAAQSWHEDVWTDVVRMRTLNTFQGQRRELNHLCPLPLDIPKRVINRWSNKGETVLDFFGGLMTVPMVAGEMGRFGYGVDLNEDYWEIGARYCFEAEYKRSVPTLFDLEGVR